VFGVDPKVRAGDFGDPAHGRGHEDLDLDRLIARLSTKELDAIATDQKVLGTEHGDLNRGSPGRSRTETATTPGHLWPTPDGRVNALPTSSEAAHHLLS
jgi:hypothetical protein